MSQNVPKLRQTARLKTIEQNILYMSQEALAEECGVDRKTIQRDIEKWRRKGGFKRFLIKEFFELYGKERLQNPSLALNRIMTLLLREEAKEDPAGSGRSIKTEIEYLIKVSRVETCSNSNLQSQS